MNKWLITLLVCLLVYEVIEHVILPLIWTVRYRKRKSACGSSGMIGKKCVVKEWNGSSGKVWVGGELWHATSQYPLKPGAQTTIQDITGLELKVSPNDV